MLHLPAVPLRMLSQDRYQSLSGKGASFRPKKNWNSSFQ